MAREFTALPSDGREKWLSQARPENPEVEASRESVGQPREPVGHVEPSASSAATPVVVEAPLPAGGVASKKILPLAR